jgi:hypothetical protein
VLSAACARPHSSDSPPPPSEGLALIRSEINVTSLRFLTPEQVNISVKKIFGVGFEGEDEAYFKTKIGILLGGVDHYIVPKRDPTIKAQTALAARYVAWYVAD